LGEWGGPGRSRARARRALALEPLEARSLLAAATQLVVAAEPPANVVVNQGFGLVVDAEDDTNAVDGTYNGTVTLSLLDNPGNATLGGTISVTAANGVATFPGVTLDQIANGYTLQATGDPSSAGAVAPVTTSAFNVNPLPATQLAVTGPPAGATVNNAFTVIVSAENGQGQVDPTYNGDVTVALGNNPAGATLGGTLTETAVNGVATFPDLTLDQIAGGYTLQFTAAGLTGVVSPSFSVAPDPASALEVATQPPSTVIAGNPFTLVVDAMNPQGLVDTSFNGPVTVDFASPGGNPAGAALLGTTTVNAVNGVATFSDLAFSKGGAGFVLEVTSGNLTAATTAPVTAAVEPATQVVFFTPPPRSLPQGIPFGLAVAAESAQGHVDPTFTGDVTLTLASPDGSTLGGTLTAPLVNGVATFAGLTLDDVGTHTIQAAVPGLGSANALPVNVTPQPATHLVVTVQPPATVGVGSAFGLTVAAENDLNQVDTSYNGAITIGLGGDPLGAVLNGLLTAQPVGGVATFTGLTLDDVGTYTIQASGAGLTAATTDPFDATDTGLAPDTPQLAPQSDTGVSDTDGVTRNNGTTAAPLVFNVTGVVPANGYVQLYDVSNPSNPILLGPPTEATDGTAVVTIQGNAALADGTYHIAASVAANTVSTPGPLSGSTPVTIATSLRVLSVTPTGDFLTGLPNNQIVVTFNRALTGLVPDQPDGSGFAGNPFAVILVPSGPEGGARAVQGLPLWSAPSGFDSGDVALPARLVYHVNDDGTSTITLTPNQPLATDVYLVSVDGLSDVAGNALTYSNGNPAPVYDSFTLQASPEDDSALEVLSVTTRHGTVPINNNSIPQPDTIAIAFNKAMDPWSIDSNTIQLLVKTGDGTYATMPSAVAYSPTTQTAYLTPEGILTPGSVYVVSVGTSVTDDQAFPELGTGLNAFAYTSFTVSGDGTAGQQRPLTVTATSPADGSAVTTALGYGAVTFSERISLSSLGRYSAMLVPQTGGVTTGNSGYADVPLNAKLAFNPNTNQLIIVPTGLLPNNTIYLFSLSGISASNGDTLTVPGGGTTFYSSFQLQAPVTSSTTPVAFPAVSSALSAPAPPAVVSNPAGQAAVAHPPSASTARAFAAAQRRGRPAQGQGQGASGLSANGLAKLRKSHAQHVRARGNGA
jgi:hypothetical protein